MTHRSTWKAFERRRFKNKADAFKLSKLHLPRYDSENFLKLVLKLVETYREKD